MSLTLTRAYINSILNPYLASDFGTFVHQNRTQNVTYELVPGDFASKLSIPSSAQQHELASVFKCHDAAIKMILERLAGREVKDLKIGARVLRVVVDTEQCSAAVELELFGDAKSPDKPFILANALFLDFDEQLKYILV